MKTKKILQRIPRMMRITSEKKSLYNIKMFKLSREQMTYATLAVVAVLVYFMFFNQKSNYGMKARYGNKARYAPGNGNGKGNGKGNGNGNGMKPNGNGNGMKPAPMPVPAANGNGGVGGMNMDEPMYAPVGGNGNGSVLGNGNGCAMKNGVGLSSSLLPREVAAQENFGEFAPQDVLKGQSFLDPRKQVGMPETAGGSLRNSNQQIRSEPPNPKKEYVWQNSTIVPDLMQRKICT